MSPKKYYKFDKDSDITKCLECGKTLKGRKFYNIKRHLKGQHKIDIEKINTNNSGSDGETDPEIPGKKPRKNSSVNITMDKNQFLKCCVGLITVKNIPFRIFDDEEFFKKIIAPYEQKFGTKLNSKNIVSAIEKCGEQVTEIISKRLKNKMISLKVDIATRMDKSILGINVQYIKDFKICINTLGKYILLFFIEWCFYTVDKLFAED